MPLRIYFLLMTSIFFGRIIAQSSTNTEQLRGPIVETQYGSLEGTRENSGIQSFKGIPYASPPVGAMRWKAPQRMAAWKDLRSAKGFGPRAMQPPIFGDMIFRSNGMSEDCLYLNIWTPDTKARLPVLVYFYGGGFVAGDGSEGRYDGESMAQKGIVSITVNYRLGVFGLLCHPELSGETSYKGSGNYGLMDQAMALEWVKENIAAFGGDPGKITIAGESAGSVSVSALMVSPLSKKIIAGAIGESGSLLGTMSPVTLADAEKNGEAFLEFAGVRSIAELRALSADTLLGLSSRFGPFRFSFSVDGYFLPREPLEMYRSGEQSSVPLLAGWNSEEMNYRMLLGNESLNKANYRKAVQKLYKENSEDILQVYDPATDADVEQVASDLCGDRFIGFSTWRWIDMQAKTGGKPVYRYYYSRPRPAMKTEEDAKSGRGASAMPLSKGAVHSAEIEYCMGNLHLNGVYAWTKDDEKVSQTMQSYFANFIKYGDPNGSGNVHWPSIRPGSPVPVMNIDVESKVMTEVNSGRYRVMEQLESKK
jgi:para-nitrobenzyl esterase